MKEVINIVGCGPENLSRHIVRTYTTDGVESEAWGITADHLYRIIYSRVKVSIFRQIAEDVHDEIP